jgi:hypothetical protein
MLKYYGTINKGRRGNRSLWPTSMCPVADLRILRNIFVNVIRTPVEIRTKVLLDYVNILHLHRREERRCRIIAENDTKGKQ